MRPSQDLREGLQSRIDLKNMDKLVIQISDRSSIRKVSKTPIAMETYSQSTPTLPIAAEPVQAVHVVSNPVPALSPQPLLQQHRSYSTNQPFPLLAHQSTGPLPQQFDKLSLPTNQQSDYWISPDRKWRYRQAAMSLFEQPCSNFLLSIPCPNVDCRYNHEMPTTTTILNKMDTYPNEKIRYIYDTFIVQYPLTFCGYFSVICRLYGLRKMRSVIAALVKDCEKYERFDYFNYIYEGLLLCELSEQDALTTIVDRCRACHASDEVIVQIIQRDPLSFLDILHIHAAKLNLNLMNKLMDEVAKSCNVNKLTTCVDLLQRVVNEKNASVIDNIDKDVKASFLQAILDTVPNLSQRLLNIILA